MGETGASRVPGNLDPSAEEFRPRNQMTSFIPTQIYYPYTHMYPSTEVQLMPFCERGGGGGYPQFAAPAVYAGPFVGKSSLSLSPPMWKLSATPTRTLLLSSVATDVSEVNVRRELEAFGEVRSVEMERVCDGIVAVSFYDLRHAQAGLTEIREQHMQQQSRLRMHYNSLLTQNLASQVEDLPTPQPPPAARGLISGRAVWAQFMIPTTRSSPDGHNQGTVVVFNLDLEVSTNKLSDIFETFGPIKELRETPLKPHQRFVEFFDIRDAGRARREMNGKEIQGKRVVIEFSRPGGHGKRFLNGIDSSGGGGVSSSSHRINNPTCPPTLPRKPSEKSSVSNIPPRSYLSPTQTRSSTKKSNVGMDKRSSNVGTNIEASTTSICLTASVVNGIEDSNGVPRRNPKKSLDSSSTAKQQQALRNQLWKERQKNFNSRFLINEDAITESNFKDSRTTVMIKNIPNKYSQQLMMNMLDNHCIHCNEQILEGEEQPLSSYDFLYLPIDFNNKCNVGYGFVNMTSPQATVRLYKAFHHQSWEVFNSTKICEITYARVQGLEALKEHFENSKFLCETKAYLPVVFSPPRDGRQLTEPQVIAGHYESNAIINIIDNGTKASTDGDREEKMIGGPDRLSNGDDHVCYSDEDDDQDQASNYGGDDDEEDSNICPTV